MPSRNVTGIITGAILAQALLFTSQLILHYCGFGVAKFGVSSTYTWPRRLRLVIVGDIFLFYLTTEAVLKQFGTIMKSLY